MCSPHCVPTMYKTGLVCVCKQRLCYVELCRGDWLVYTGQVYNTVCTVHNVWFCDVERRLVGLHRMLVISLRVAQPKPFTPIWVTPVYISHFSLSSFRMVIERYLNSLSPKSAFPINVQTSSICLHSSILYHFQWLIKLISGSLELAYLWGLRAWNRGKCFYG